PQRLERQTHARLVEHSALRRALREHVTRYAEQPGAPLASAWVERATVLQGSREGLGAEVGGRFQPLDPAEEEAKDVLLVPKVKAAERLRAAGQQGGILAARIRGVHRSILILVDFAATCDAGR